MSFDALIEECPCVARDAASLTVFERIERDFGVEGLVAAMTMSRASGPPSPSTRPHDKDCPLYEEWRDLSSFVYFIQSASGPIKIGKSGDPLRRLRGLQTAHFERLELLGAVPGGEPLEATLHASLADHRMHGEWFRPEREVLFAVRHHLGLCIDCSSSCEHHAPECRLVRAPR